MTRSISPRAAASSCPRRVSIPPGKSDDSTSMRMSGKMQRRLLGQPLDARPAGGQRVGLVAGGADLRPRLDMAAVMADERGAEPVLDQPCGAVRALEPMAAGAAEGERRIAAPVEEQQRLLAALARRLHAGDRLLREPPSARRPFAPQVDRRDLGHGRCAEARGEPQPAIAAGLGVETRLQRRRGGGQHDRRLLEPRPHDRHVAGVVDDAFFLLEGAARAPRRRR